VSDDAEIGLTSRSPGQISRVDTWFGDPSDRLPCAGATASLTYNQVVVDILTDGSTDRIFQALADTTRRDILVRAILQEQSVSALARHYEMSFAAVQKHVAVLERATLVTKRRHGREQIVQGNASTLRTAAALLDAYEQLWIERATQIADLLGSEEGDTA
jgi:DNA-binding transcriptional ArsR family regulator